MRRLPIVALLVVCLSCAETPPARSNTHLLQEAERAMLQAQWDRAATQYERSAFFRFLARLSTRGVPQGAALFSAALSVAALLVFSTFSRIVTYFVVPVQLVNILMVASVFRLRRRSALQGTWWCSSFSWRAPSSITRWRP